MNKLNIDHKVLLSVIWVFVLMNMIYADIIGMLRPGYLELLDSVSQELTPGAVLTFSVLLEIPIAMILLSRILNRKANRVSHFIAVPISIVYVIYGGLTNPPISYLFFASIEIIAMIIAFWIAYQWRSPKLAS